MITAARIVPYSIPLNMSFAISKGSLESAANVIVLLQCGEKYTGLGEAAPFPVLTGDTQVTTIPAAKEIASRLIGKTTLQALQLVLNDLRMEFQKYPSALTGIEMALWDLRAKELGVPLAELWGSAGLKEKWTDITLPIMPKQSLPSFWERFAAFAFPIVKVKVGGGTVTEDVERIVDLCKLMPKGTRITLDGNQGCTVESAQKKVEQLNKAGVYPEFFEQPLPADDWKGMQTLTSKSTIPICADETVKSAADAIRVVSEKAAHMINLKFMKSGIAETLRIIHIARAANMPLMIGGMVESEIAMTASLHAVCGTDDIEWCDLDTPFFFSVPVCTDSPYHKKSARLQLPRGPGLGLEIREL